MYITSYPKPSSNLLLLFLQSESSDDELLSPISSSTKTLSSISQTSLSKVATLPKNDISKEPSREEKEYFQNTNCAPDLNGAEKPATNGDVNLENGAALQSVTKSQGLI